MCRKRRIIMFVFVVLLRNDDILNRNRWYLHTTCIILQSLYILFYYFYWFIKTQIIKNCFAHKKKANDIRNKKLDVYYARRILHWGVFTPFIITLEVLTNIIFYELNKSQIFLNFEFYIRPGCVIYNCILCILSSIKISPQKKCNDGNLFTILRRYRRTTVKDLPYIFIIDKYIKHMSGVKLEYRLEAMRGRLFTEDDKRHPVGRLKSSQ